MKRALISVSDKTGLVEFARSLSERGFELVSTGGTAKVLMQAGLSELSVSDVTGFPEMMDGRVKTLHPMIHGGILARRSKPNDLTAATKHGIHLIDLVVVNLYPFVETATKPDIPFDALIEEIDIGGPSLVRAAAKNFKDVLVVVSPTDYPLVIEQLDSSGGPTTDFRFSLAQKAFAHTGAYDTAIATTLAGVDMSSGGVVKIGNVDGAPKTLALTLRKLRDLRYGENPHQTAAWYTDETEIGLGGAAVLQGKELSYTNLLDLDAAARIALEFDEPTAVVIKHTNPCGVSTSPTIASAYINAREADSLSAFGGIVGLNRAVDIETAEALISTFIEAVIAPVIDEDARPILAKKPKMRVITADFSAFEGDAGIEVRSILGATLVQARDQVTEALSSWPDDALRVVTQRKPTPKEWRALRFAWRICAHVKSNTVIFTGIDQTLAIGAGQMSRVDAVNVAKMKVASEVLKGSVAASDAFFPFRDGLDAINAAGATAVIQPGGSVRDAEVIAAADEHEIAMVFTARRHFRH